MEDYGFDDEPIDDSEEQNRSKSKKDFLERWGIDGFVKT